MGVRSDDQEALLADTTFVSVWQAVTSQSPFRSLWPRSVLRRIEAAAISISVVTVAELRAGHLKAQWGHARRAEAERWLQRFTHVTVDRRVAHTWAALKDAARRRGRACSDNDLWIAATGSICGVPIVTCDRDFQWLCELGIEVVYLPRRPAVVPTSP